MIKRKVTEFILGQMVENMKGFGPKENNIVMVNIYIMMVPLRQEFGKMEKDKSGLLMRKKKMML